MILILIALIVMAGMSAFLFTYSDEGYTTKHFTAGIIGFLIAIASSIGVVVYAFSAWSWFAAEHKALIINREYGTNYTQTEVFWASDVINTMRELDRKRIEVNGDLMRDKSANKDKEHE